MLALLIFIGIIFIDQAVKFLIVTNLTLGQTVQFIPGIISITREQNSGVAFSMLSGINSTILAMISVVIVLVIVILMATKVIDGRGQRRALTFVVAGAISNALDRLVSGYVVDMFKFEFITFGIFNVADICIVCGIIVFAILWLKSDSDKKASVDSNKKGRSGIGWEEPTERKGRSAGGNQRKKPGHTTGKKAGDMNSRSRYDLPEREGRSREPGADSGYDVQKKYTLEEILKEFYEDRDDF